MFQGETSDADILCWIYNTDTAPAIIAIYNGGCNVGAIATACLQAVEVDWYAYKIHIFKVSAGMNQARISIVGSLDGSLDGCVGLAAIKWHIEYGGMKARGYDEKEQETT